MDVLCGEITTYGALRHHVHICRPIILDESNKIYFVVLLNMKVLTKGFVHPQGGTIAREPE